MSLALSELTIDNMGAWPTTAKAGLIVIACTILLLVGYMIDISELREQLYYSNVTEKKLRKKFTKKYQLSTNLEIYKDQMHELNDHFNNLLQQLPQSNEVPGIIDDISHAGLANGLVIKSIHLKNEMPREFYAELPFDIEVIGSYHSIGSFISDVSALSRIVTLHDFQIKTSNSKNSHNNLEMKIRAKTYRYTAKKDKI